MKQFNLEEYLKNPSREIVTRDGYPVKIMCTNFHLSGYPIVAEIDDKEYGTKQSWTFDKNGQYNMFNGKTHRKDLFFAPKKYEGWINIFRDSGKDINIMGYYTSNPYDSEEKAIAIGRNAKNYVNTIKIEWEADE